MYLLSEVQVAILAYYVVMTTILSIVLTYNFINLSKKYDVLNNSFKYHVISAPPLKAQKRKRKNESVGTK